MINSLERINKEAPRENLNPLEPPYKILLENPFHKSPRSTGKLLG
jgi:hypothetical protein